MDSFKDKVFRIASSNDSRIVLAFDRHHLFKEGLSYELFRDSLALLNSLRGLVSGIKIGIPTVLTLGEGGVYRLINEYDWGFFFIADFKIADVEHINRAIVRHIADLGFDGLIAHSIIGYEGGLKAIVDEAREYGLGVLALVAMTHKGAGELLNKLFEESLEVALKSGVDGFILPASKPEYIKYVRSIAEDKIIMSPGVGFQGASFGSAVDAGADFEIIGRSIYMTEDPRKAAEEIRRVLRWRRD